MKSIPSLRLIVLLLATAFAGSAIQAWDADNSGATWPDGSIPWC